MNEYLEETKMCNFNAPEIADLITKRGWRELDEFHKIGAVYDFVQNEILFGFNAYDTLTATEVLFDGIGQCNTKATLLMALLRGVGIPSRLRGFEVSKGFQKGATSGIISFLSPERIVHTWAEVYYRSEWIALEGVIIDKQYLNSVKQRYNGITGRFMRYAIATASLENLSVDWTGKSTFIQSEAVVHDFGTFQSPDVFFERHSQNFSKVIQFLYGHFGRRMMTKNVVGVRNWSKK